MTPGRRDAAKVYALAAVRSINRRALEHWSRWTFRARRRHGAAAGPPALVCAADRYGNRAIPRGIHVLAPIPAASRLSFGYVGPYYGLASLAFRCHRRWPIGPCEWDRGARYASLFPENDEGWSDIQDDEQFACLRLQGPNPFLLRVERDELVVDYGPAFAGVWEPVRCRFTLRHGRLTPAAIDIGGTTVGPRDRDEWERAKLVANALDARYAIFGQHLTTCHFLIAQAFAIAAHDLPGGHRLAGTMELLTRGVLEVNDYALRLLLRPESYFLQSNFIDQAMLFGILANRIASFSATELEPDRDIAARGLRAVPDHPYVADATDAWTAVRRYTDALVARYYCDDDDVREDHELQAWHARLRTLLPNCSGLTLGGKDDLAIRLASLVYNNVTHEVSGDYSPYTGARTVAAKALVRLDALSSEPPMPPRLADVFLFEQGAYAGTFNVRGNNMMSTDVSRLLTEEETRAVEELRRELRTYERVVDERNQYRLHPFQRMRPTQWEWSVSF